MFRVSNQDHISILPHLAAELTPGPWRNGGKPQKYLLTRQLLLLKGMMAGVNYYSGGELLLDGHIASALASLIIQFTWAWQVPRTLKQSTSLCARHASFHEGPKQLGTVCLQNVHPSRHRQYRHYCCHTSQDPEGTRRFSPDLTFGASKKKKKIFPVPTSTRRDQWGHCHLPGSWN